MDPRTPVPLDRDAVLAPVVRTGRVLEADADAAGSLSARLGMAPMSYLLQWRLQMAWQLLRGTTLSIAAVAERVGYGSEASLSRAFKRHVGVPPAAWRRPAGGATH